MKAIVTSVIVLIAMTANAESNATNSLLKKWTGPYGGVPPFDKVKVADFKPALEAAMAEQKLETEAIAKNTAPPTFENTLLALENSGETLSRVYPMFDVWRS